MLALVRSYIVPRPRPISKFFSRATSSQDYEEFSKILLNKDAGDHERVQVTKVKRKIATHAKKDVRLGASADESKDSAH